jgi:alkane 1-monooxygenase
MTKHDVLSYAAALCFFPLLHLIGFYVPSLRFSGVLIGTFVLVPLLDAVLPKRNPVHHKKSQEMYRIPLYIYELVHNLVWFYSLKRSIELWDDPLTFILHGISLGTITTAPGNAVSHELFHKLNPLDRFLGQWHLVLTYYSHFHLEHTMGHHKNVATDKDPASARYGETLYHFLARSSIGGLINSYQMETQRLGHNISTYDFITKHRIFRNIILFYILFPVFIYLVFGPIGLLTFFIQACAAIFFIEGINYVEHYGLERKKLDDGTYEPISEKHSWDASRDFSSYIYVNIMLHSDHHTSSLKNYELLENKPQAAVMRYDYNLMILIATMPRLFFSIVHPILKEHKLQ